MGYNEFDEMTLAECMLSEGYDNEGEYDAEPEEELDKNGNEEE